MSSNTSIPPGLAGLGWDEARSEEWSEHARPGVTPGRVVRDDRTLFHVLSEDGNGSSLPIAAPLRREGVPRPTTGDWVVVADGEITAILERRSMIQRADAFDQASSQVLAANVDFVLVVAALSARFRPRKLERLLVLAWQSGAVPLVVLTKADTSDDVAEALELAGSIAPGVAVHAVSAVTGEGLEGLAAELFGGSTSVMIGPSGAGKSTLANALGDGSFDLATTPVRSDGKGRHTTVRRELLPLRNGALMIDTPGLRSIGLFDAEEAIGDAFREIEELATGCRFSDCEHRTEPGCAVLEAIEDGLLTEDRLDSYRRLLRDQRRLAARFDARLRAERTREMRAFFRQQRNGFTR